MALDTIVEESQKRNHVLYEQLKNTHGWEENNGVWTKEGRIAIQSEDIKEEILKEHHDHPTAEHPGAATTYFSVRIKYWWPKMVAHCPICNKLPTFLYDQTCAL